MKGKCSGVAGVAAIFCLVSEKQEFQVGTNRSQVGTNEVQVGTNEVQVGSLEVQVGTNGLQVGTKKQLIPPNPNVFNAAVQMCLGLE